MSWFLHIVWILRHALFMVLPIGLALALLAWFVRALATRRGLSIPTTDSQARTFMRLALLGAAGQILFLFLDYVLSPPVARLIAFVVVGACAGWIASRATPFLPVGGGLFFGAMGAVPMQMTYQILVIHNDPLARMAAASILVMAIALAVTLPVPPLPPVRVVEEGTAGIDTKVGVLSASSHTLSYRPQTISDPGARPLSRGRKRKKD